MNGWIIGYLVGTVVVLVVVIVLLLMIAGARAAAAKAEAIVAALQETRDGTAPLWQLARHRVHSRSHRGGRCLGAVEPDPT